MLGRRIRRLVVDDLEEDDGDVVLAASGVRRRDECVGRALGVTIGGLDRGGHGVVGDHGREPVRADEEEIARCGLQRERVDLDGRLGSERPRYRGALRVALGLLGREHAALDQLGNEGMVGRELLERSLAQEVRA